MQKATGWRRIVNASGYSFRGLVAVYRSEAAFRQEILLAAIAIPLALWVEVSSIEKLLLIGSIVAVLVVELLNSAIEAVVDRIGEEYHTLSGKAKDAGSAAVLLALIWASLVWLMIVAPLVFDAFRK